MKIELDLTHAKIKLESLSEIKSFKRLLLYAEEDFKNFPHLSINKQLEEDYKFMRQLLTSLSNPS